MTAENKSLAYELYLRHWPYARIAAQLGAKQGDVIRAVADAERRQNTLCARCRWRKDGLEVCLLPTCMRDGLNSLGGTERKNDSDDEKHC